MEIKRSIFIFDCDRQNPIRWFFVGNSHCQGRVGAVVHELLTIRLVLSSGRPLESNLESLDQLDDFLVIGTDSSSEADKLCCCVGLEGFDFLGLFGAFLLEALDLVLLSELYLESIYNSLFTISSMSFSFSVIYTSISSFSNFSNRFEVVSVILLETF